jgi:gliding motility-associated lipoprotein GldH
MRQKLGLLTIIILFFFGCDSTRVYEDFQELPEGWAVGDTLQFRVLLDGSEGPYDFTTQFRCDAAYPYSNLYYYLLINNRKDSILFTGLKEVMLFEPKTGKPLGSGLGDLYNVEHPVLSDFSVIGKDSLMVSIIQYMRIDKLQGVDRVGLRVNVQED